MIMGIVDLVKDKDNFPCIIMEKCDQSVQDIIMKNQEEPIPEKQIIRILTMTCIALYHIHSKKMVHRDLKPGNILQKYVGT
jgi:serine/threonine protein kinase